MVKDVFRLYLSMLETVQFTRNLGRMATLFPTRFKRFQNQKRARRSGLPEADAADDAGGVVHEDEALGEVEVLEVAGVAAADVEASEVDEGLHVVEGLEHALEPLLAADALQGGVAELLVVGFALAEGDLGDFEVRASFPWW